MRRRVFDVVARVGSLAVVAVAGALLAGTGAYAATRWAIVGSRAVTIQSVTVYKLVIKAVVSPVATNVLYPGGSGDVVVTISNPNPYPVTITAVSLPTNTTYASGYTTRSFSAKETGCSLSTSDVAWSYSTAATGSSHMLTKPLTVAASGQSNDPLTVTFVNDAYMGALTPTECEDVYFSMPAMTGVIGTRGPASVSRSPATDGWTT